ncbi:NACHT domain- and WD repeat-containing protein 1-like isoform X2 [Rhopilema esculentum]|uniref:NACHT domain- and WD repeat-containing protein 1-like isoform X2 n=1 Tax=Rhopilema esculentum TaxID=499914 RepID=UPI0031D8F5D2
MGVLISKKKSAKKVSSNGLNENQSRQNQNKFDHRDVNTHEGKTKGKSDAFKLNPETSKVVLQVLQGSLESHSAFKAKIVRVFVSSTFTDTIVERNALMQEAYPKIKKFCQELGYEFQVVDMRWGIRAEALDDHQTLELCIREIEKCQNLSTGPSFLSLLSEKYGFCPIPSKISKKEFRAIASQISDDNDFQLLLSWYLRDENHQPPVYVLQPISSHIPDFVNYTNETVRKRAVKEWYDVMTKMAKILRNAAEKVLLGKERRKYFASVTEAETEKGVFQSNDKSCGIFWFKRNIDGLSDATDEKVEKYLDKPDDEKDKPQVYLANIQNRMLNEMKEDNVIQYNIKWNPKGVSLEDEEHSKYIASLCKDVSETMKKAIEEKINERSRNEANLAIYEEVLQHISFAKSRCIFFHGRQQQLEKIHEYLNGSESYPLVVYGESGSGKTSVLSMVLKCCQEWFNSGSAVVTRFLGITPDSSLLRRLLMSLCQQISFLLDREYNENKVKIVKEAKDEFVNLLKLSESHFTAETPLVIILDSLDQLSPEDGAFQLSWLPMKLPPWAKMVVSTISQDKYDCLKNLKALITEQCFLSIPLLPIDDAVQIIDDWLGANKKTLTEDQKKTLLHSFEKCSLPIFLKVSFEEALRWKSYTPVDEVRLETTVRGAIKALFERTERQHGDLFAKRTLAYITAAKSGLTESELEDILSCDDEVLEDVYQYWVPPVRRIPPLLWLRMKHDLSSYLVDRGADESRVVTWYHRQFKEAAVERYLSDKEETRRIHKAISEYFLGRWANGNQKPFENKDGDTEFMDRLVAAQTLIFSPEDYCRLGSVSFNFRKLSELPFHLVRAGELDLLKKECLCNYEFLLTHLRARGLSDVLDGFDLAISTWPDDKDLTTVHETLKLSMNALSLWPGQLASQLISRMPKETINRSEFLELLEKQAREPSLPALVPNMACLTSPGGPLLQSLSGSSELHVGLRLSRDGKTLASIGESNELLVWDVAAGRVFRNLPFPDGGVTYSCLTAKGEILIISRFGIIKAWLLSTGQTLLDIKGHDETSPISTCLFNGQEALAAFYSETLTIINLENGEILKEYTTKLQDCSEKPTKIMLSSWNEKCLVVHKDLIKEEQFSMLLELFDISPELKHDLFRIKVDHDIMSLEIVSCNQILVTSAVLEDGLNTSRRPSARPSVASNWQKMSLELWDIRTMKMKTTLASENEFVRCSCITPDRNEVILLCNTNFIETACEFMGFIKIHSVVDGSSVKMPLSYPSSITSVCGTGFRCIVTASLDKIIRVWDLERSLDKNTDARKISSQSAAHTVCWVGNAVGEGKAEERNEEAEQYLSANETSSAMHWKTEVTKFDSNDKDGDKQENVNTDENRAKQHQEKQQEKHEQKQKQQQHEKQQQNEQQQQVHAQQQQQQQHEKSIPVQMDTSQSYGVQNDTKERRISRNVGWEHVNSFPVGKKFLKLRYSNLSSAVHSLVVESGSSLEDLQIATCHDKILVYFARRIIDSVFSAIVWNLKTDVKVRVSGLQNPEAVICKCDTYYVVVLSSSVLTLYNANSGEFVKSIAVDVDDKGSERLASISNDIVVLVEKGRRSMKVFSLPSLKLVKSVSVGETEVIARVFSSKNMKRFIVCKWKPKPGEGKGFQQSVEIWNSETVKNTASLDYGILSTEFNDTIVSNDGSVLVDLVFDPNKSEYCLVVWKSGSSTPETLPCDAPVTVFALEPQSNKIIIGTWNGDLLLYDIDSLKLKRLAKAHTGALQFILLSRKNKMILTVAGAFNSRDRSLRLWNAESGKLITEYTPDVKISSIAMTEDERFIVLEIQGRLIRFELMCKEV